MIYLELKNKDKIIFSNIPKEHKKTFETDKNYKKNNIKSFFKKDENHISIWLITNDKDLYKSPKLFNKTFDIINRITNELSNHYSLVTLSNTHTIATIQAKMAQQLEGFIEEDIQRGEYQKSILKVEEVVKKNILEAAKLICDLSKRVKEIDTHLKSLQILNTKVGELSLTQHPLKKILLKIYAPFEKKFQDKNIRIVFDRIKETENIKIDYDIFNLVMHHFFDNATKYSKNNDRIEFIFSTNNELFINMHSLTIENKDKIFNMGYSGDNAGNLAGNGIGMNVIKRGLLAMNMDINIIDNGRLNNHDKYSKNKFIITCIKT